MNRLATSTTEFSKPPGLFLRSSTSDPDVVDSLNSLRAVASFLVEKEEKFLLNTPYFSPMIVFGFFSFI